MTVCRERVQALRCTAATRSPLPARQRGRMIEYTLIGVALIFAGAALAPLHAAWSVLIVFGVLWLFYPTAAGWAYTWRTRRAIGARLETLKAGGFSADLVLKGKLSFEESWVALDFGAGTIACIRPDGTNVLPLSTLRSVTIGSDHRHGFGQPTPSSWYFVGFGFSGHAEPEAMRVACGSRLRAGRWVRALRRRLPDTVEISIEKERGMNPKSADTLIVLAVILNGVALAVISPTGWFAFAVLAAVTAAVPAAFARRHRRVVGIGVLALSVASAIWAYPAHDRSMTLYQKSSKERAAKPQPAAPPPPQQP